MRHKRLNQEISKDALNVLNLLRLPGSLSNPSPRLRPGLVQSEQTALASALDELIRLRDELDTGLEEPWVCDLGLVENGIDVGILGEVQ